MEIKSLNQHQSLSAATKIKKKHLNTLNIKGQFTKNDMNMWMNALLPDVYTHLKKQILAAKLK